MASPRREVYLRYPPTVCEMIVSLIYLLQIRSENIGRRHWMHGPADQLDAIISPGKPQLKNKFRSILDRMNHMKCDIILDYHAALHLHEP